MQTNTKMGMLLIVLPISDPSLAKVTSAVIEGFNCEPLLTEPDFFSHEQDSPLLAQDFGHEWGITHAKNTYMWLSIGYNF